MLYVRSLRERRGARFGRDGSGDGGIPLVALQTSNIWGNVVTALVLFLSPASDLGHEDPETEYDGGEVSDIEDEWSEMVHDLGGEYCGVYEHCSHGEVAALFVNLVNNTGTTAYLLTFNCVMVWGLIHDLRFLPISTIESE